MIALDDKDFDIEHGVLTVTGKFGKPRQVPLHPSSVAALAAYRHYRKTVHPRPGTPALFVSTPGTRLINVSVNATFSKLVGRSGLTPRSASCRPRPHDLRHSFAVATHHAGVDITVIALWLGHENINTTQITCKPTSPSSSKPWTGRLHYPAHAAATGPPTTSSPSSKVCDYADFTHPGTPPTSTDRLHLGISRGRHNAHLLRDLEGATQVYPDAVWPTQIADALRGLIHHANLAREQSLPAIDADNRDALLTRLHNGMLVGLSDTISHGTRPGERKARLLLEVLRDRPDDVLRFAHDLKVPPTSNQAERDLRPSKIQQKISGRLTSEERTQDRYTILGYLSTATEHGLNKITVLRDARCSSGGRWVRWKWWLVSGRSI